MDGVENMSMTKTEAELAAEEIRSEMNWPNNIMVDVNKLAAIISRHCPSSPDVGAMREALKQCHPARVWDLARQHYAGCNQHNCICVQQHDRNCKLVDAALASVPAEQVDTTLEQLLEYHADLASMRLGKLPIGALNAERYQIVLEHLKEVAVHAKSQNESMNERLLAAAKEMVASVEEWKTRVDYQERFGLAPNPLIIAANNLAKATATAEPTAKNS